MEGKRDMDPITGLPEDKAPKRTGANADVDKIEQREEGRSIPPAQSDASRTEEALEKEPNK